MNRNDYLNQIHGIRAKVDRVEDMIHVWDYNEAYKKLLMIGLESERLATQISKDERYKNPRIVLDRDRKKIVYGEK